MCASETSGGSCASTRSAAASASGSCGPRRRSGCGASGAGPSRTNRTDSSGSGRRLLHPAVLLEPPRQLLGRLLGFQLSQIGVLLEEPSGLQLEQRRDQHQELATGLQIEPLARCKPLDEGDHDPRDVDLGEVELVLEDERQQQVEGAFEGVEIQLELAHDHGGQASGAPGHTGPRPSKLHHLR